MYAMLLILASAAVAVADVFLKKASTFPNFSAVLKNPWMVSAILLYIFQIIIFVYLFFIGEKLIDVGIVQIILYASIIVISSMLFFHEPLTLVKIIGIILGITGIILINL
jgi:drug/metabolite transporter (DMT)-like permease